MPFGFLLQSECILAAPNKLEFFFGSTLWWFRRILWFCLRAHFIRTCKISFVENVK